MMTKRPVHWKPVKTKDISGREFRNPYFMPLLSGYYRGTLLSEILSMPIQKPISFEEAAGLTHAAFLKAFTSRRIGHASGQTHWYFKNFVQWISDQGYHIELTGDEFEGYVLSDKVA